MHIDSSVFVVDDDPVVLESMSRMLHNQGLQVECFPSAEAFLAQVPAERPGCLVVDYRMPGMGGLELLRHLSLNGMPRAAIMFTGHADVQTAVGAMRLGAINFLEKPVDPDEIIASIHDALLLDARQRSDRQSRQELEQLLAKLSHQERTLLVGLLQGLTNRDMAQRLDVSLRTIQFRRSSLFAALGVTTKAELIARLTQAGWTPDVTSALLPGPA